MKEELKQHQSTNAAKQKALLSSLENSKAELAEFKLKFSEQEKMLAEKHNLLQENSLAQQSNASTTNEQL